MEKKEVIFKAIDLSEVRHQLITMPLYWVALLFVAGWIGKPWLVEATGFVTMAVAEEKIEPLKAKVENLSDDMENLSKKFDTHISEFRLTGAFQMEQALKANLSRHQNEPTDTPGHYQDVERLKRQAVLATEYKECLLAEKNNCEIIRKQLLK